MSTVVSWNSSGSRTLRVPTQSKWAEVGRGLALVTAGYFALFVLAAPGVLLWAASRGAKTLLGLGLDGAEDVEVVGLLVGSAGALLGGVLLLIGLWRCLGYAPQEENAKELVFACLLALLVAIPLAVAAPFLGSPWDSRILDRFIDAINQRQAPPIGSALQATALALGLVSLMTFSQFVRVVSGRFEDRFVARGLELFFVFVWLLLGVSIGACLALRRLTAPETLHSGLAAGWGLCLAWHVVLIGSARRAVRRGLRPADPGYRRDDSPPKRYSGLHRLLPTQPG